MEAAICKNEGCGRKFTPKRRSQKYCSDTCREEYYAMHYFFRTTVTKICPNCLEEFTTTCPKKQIYCSEDCRSEARNKRVDTLRSSRIQAEEATYLGDRYAAFEKDEFKCTICGRGVLDGVALDVIEEEAHLKTVCNECKQGREVSDKREREV